MRKLVVLLLTIALIAAAFAAPAAGKKGKKTKPVETVLYMHGNAPVGDYVEFGLSISEDTHMMMDPNEPDSSTPKSFGYSQLVGNEECTGNPLFPSWEGKLAGTIVGDINWTIHTLAAPSEVVARLWVDIPFSSCTSDAAGVDNFVPPLAEKTVEVPAGHGAVEIVFEDIKVKAAGNMILELSQRSPAHQGRVLYDSTSFMSNVKFDCIPAKGKSCV